MRSMSLLALCCLPALAHAQVELKARLDANGIRTDAVATEYQGPGAEIRVLLPDKLDKDKRYPVVYVLPVEAKNGAQFGDGLAEIKKHDLHNKLGVICVMPILSHLPWYADHPTDMKIRQESYLLKVVLPFIEKHYPASMIRWLLGFSKSGWGAFSLLLRHPDVFQKAVAWDAPLMMTQPNKYGMEGIFATQENFEKYQISKLLETRGKTLGKEPRLLLLGYASFRAHHEDAHKLMQRLEIPHAYRDDKKTPHTWHSGWVEPGLRWLATSK